MCKGKKLCGFLPLVIYISILDSRGDFGEYNVEHNVCHG